MWRPGAGGGDQRDAGRAECGGVYGVGEVGDGLAGGGGVGAGGGRLIHLGVVSQEAGARGRCLLIDLGGGSCEITFSDEGRIRQMVSLPLGAVRLQQEFLHGDPPAKEDVARLKQYIGRELRKAERGWGVRGWGW